MSERTQKRDRSAELFDLSGRRALVTGGSRGIGRAIAVGFAARGADVVAVSRGREGLDETVGLANGAPGSITALQADLHDPVAIEGCVVGAAETLGGLDIVVNNAGADHDSKVEDTDLDTWRRVVDLNLQSCFLVARAASSHLTDGDGGKLINVASMLGVVGIRDNGAYVASKHGLVGLTRSLALEWARRNVQVNALCPGFTATEMTKGLFDDEKLLTWIKRNTPAGRTAETSDLVGPAVFLASGASDFMTGQVLVVDGGWTAQ